MNTKINKKVIAVVGPTGTGKTYFALKFAKQIGGELINCDSRQVYKGMDIGTNKGSIQPTTQVEIYQNKKLLGFNVENSNILGWLFDIIEPNEQLSLADYQKYTYFIIEQIQKRGHIPILVGGTGLYLDALVKGYQLNDIKPDFKLRETLGKMTAEELFQKLLGINKKKANSLNESDSKNPRRLIRAIEESLASPDDYNPKSIKKTRSPVKKNKAKKLDLTIIYPDFTRDELYTKIDERVLEMVSSGLVEETKKIIDKYSSELEVLKGIGYKEVIEYLDEKITLSEMIANIQQGHKNYIKRQITWFEGGKRNYDLLKIEFNKQLFINQIIC
jgi:tRNA dimethylallyltransferase